MSIAAVVLAAGKGTRFASKDVNKVVLPLAGKPIILYSIELLEKISIANIFVVVGFAKDSVKKVLFGHNVTFVEQKKQLGTADALASALPQLPLTTKNVLVINGDDLFQKEETIRQVISSHNSSEAAITFTTSNLENPTGLGRIVRNRRGEVVAIIEEKDVKEEQRKIKEVNVACYVFTIDFLKKYISKLTKSNVTGEYYLTDLIAMAIANGQRVETVSVEEKWKGINSPEDLKEAKGLLSQE